MPNYVDSPQPGLSFLISRGAVSVNFIIADRIAVLAALVGGVALCGINEATVRTFHGSQTTYKTCLR